MTSFDKRNRRMSTFECLHMISEDIMEGAHFSFEGNSPLLDIDEVGERLGLTREAIYARRHRDDFPPAILMGGVLRWRIEDVEAWLDERREVTS
jgi:predicted DNA-binding transcriptional regulator AlpA